MFGATLKESASILMDSGAVVEVQCHIEPRPTKNGESGRPLGRILHVGKDHLVISHKSVPVYVAFSGIIAMWQPPDGEEPQEALPLNKNYDDSVFFPKA